ncbi:MAG: hypothetical protein AAF517_26645, partial [Planctomycetota bacterium]
QTLQEARDEVSRLDGESGVLFNRLGTFQYSRDATARFEELDVDNRDLRFKSGWFSGWPTNLYVFSSFDGQAKQVFPLQGKAPEFQRYIAIALKENEMDVTFLSTFYCSD